MERYFWERGRKNRICIFDRTLGRGDAYNDAPIAWAENVDAAQKIVDALNRADDRRPDL